MPFLLVSLERAILVITVDWPSPNRVSPRPYCLSAFSDPGEASTTTGRYSPVRRKRMPLRSEQALASDGVPSLKGGAEPHAFSAHSAHSPPGSPSPMIMLLDLHVGLLLGASSKLVA